MQEEADRRKRHAAQGDDWMPRPVSSHAIPIAGRRRGAAPLVGGTHLLSQSCPPAPLIGSVPTPKMGGDMPSLDLPPSSGSMGGQDDIHLVSFMLTKQRFPVGSQKVRHAPAPTGALGRALFPTALPLVREWCRHRLLCPRPPCRLMRRPVPRE